MFFEKSCNFLKNISSVIAAQSNRWYTNVNLRDIIIKCRLMAGSCGFAERCTYYALQTSATRPSLDARRVQTLFLFRAGPLAPETASKVSIPFVCTGHFRKSGRLFYYFGWRLLLERQRKLETLFPCYCCSIWRVSLSGNPSMTIFQKQMEFWKGQTNGVWHFGGCLCPWCL